MSGRSTAEIVADLGSRWHISQGVRDCMDEAADRLTELDATVAAVVAALDQYDVDRHCLATYGNASTVCVSAIAKAVRP